MIDRKNMAALACLLTFIRQQGYAYTAVTPLTQATVNARAVNAKARDLVGIFGWSRPFDAHILPAGMFELMQQAQVLARHADGWRSLVRLSTLHDMLFMHSAYPTDEADAVFFGPDTYRFADAIVQALASRQSAIRRAIDIGCGAGPGASLIARACPDAEVLAADINDKALTLTRVNVMAAGLANISACYSNLLHDVPGAFDFIVANPPYLVDPAERTYRHGGGPLGAGLALEIIEASMQRLAPGGTLLLYTGVAIVDGKDPFLEAAEKYLQAADVAWVYRETDPDIFGEELLNDSYAEADRIAAVVLTATKHV